MQFFNWTTDYQLYKQQVPKREQEDYAEFFQRRYRQQLSAGLPPARLVAERLWRESENPYYNIHPNLATKLCRVDLSKIPSEMFRMPHGLDVVNIRFAQKHDEFVVAEPQHTDLTALLSMTKGTAPAGSFVHGVLMSKLSIPKEQDPSILFIVDFNQFTPLRQPIYSLFSIIPKVGMSMQDCIDVAKAKARSASYEKMLGNVLRLAVTIGFLSDNPTICEPDVLTDDRDTFQKASQEQRNVIAARAKRRGKFGFNIGTDLMFVGERPMGERRTQHETGRELEYSHIRAGHPHAVRYGEEKKMVKIMWYVPTTVRPDLKFKQ